MISVNAIYFWFVTFRFCMLRETECVRTEEQKNPSKMCEQIQYPKYDKISSRERRRKLERNSKWMGMEGIGMTMIEELHVSCCRVFFSLFSIKVFKPLRLNLIYVCVTMLSNVMSPLAFGDWNLNHKNNSNSSSRSNEAVMTFLVYFIRLPPQLDRANREREREQSCK